MANYQLSGSGKLIPPAAVGLPLIVVEVDHAATGSSGLWQLDAGGRCDVPICASLALFADDSGLVPRNYRLAAIRSFFKHLVRNDPTHGDQYHRVLTLPSKKTHTAIAQYFEPEDMRAILKQPDGRTAQGLRDHALLSFMYNTGARVAEVLAVRLEDLSLRYPKQVVLHGKGKKERVCPLWRETVSALSRLPTVREGQRGDPIFRNRRGEPLTRNGVAYILEKYKTLAAREVPSLRGRHIAPHRVRHSAAVGLLQGGASIADIRDILGHTSMRLPAVTLRPTYR